MYKPVVTSISLMFDGTKYNSCKPRKTCGTISQQLLQTGVAFMNKYSARKENYGRGHALPERDLTRNETFRFTAYMQRRRLDFFAGTFKYCAYPMGPYFLLLDSELAPLFGRLRENPIGPYFFGFVWATGASLVAGTDWDRGVTRGVSWSYTLFIESCTIVPRKSSCVSSAPLICTRSWIPSVVTWHRCRPRKCRCS